MSRYTFYTIVFATLMLCLGLQAPKASATQWNQATRLTFNKPVELPGVSLPAGTYVFTIMRDNPDRNIVEVWNAGRTKLYTTILAVPDYRLHVSGKPVLTLNENAPGAPEEVKAWFYPGDHFGHEFVYPKSQATRIARRTHEPVLYVPDAMKANMKKHAQSAQESSVVALKNAPVRAVKPSGQDVDAGQVATLKSSNSKANASNRQQ